MCLAVPMELVEKTESRGVARLGGVSRDVNLMLVPEAAVIYDRERRAAVELPDSTAEKGRRKTPVKLGISNGVKTELLAGLSEGQKVILQ